MAKTPESGVCTRSMVKQANASLLAPARLSLQPEKHEPLPYRQQMLANNPVVMPADRDEGTYQAQSDTSLLRQRELSTNPMPTASSSNSKAIEDVPMDCGEPSSPRKQAPASEQEFRPVDSSLVVCCKVCNVIFQQVANRTVTCPFCSAKKIHKLQYGKDLKLLQSALDTCATQIKKLQQGLEKIKCSYAYLRDRPQVDKQHSPTVEIAPDAPSLSVLDLSPKANPPIIQNSDMVEPGSTPYTKQTKPCQTNASSEILINASKLEEEVGASSLTADLMNVRTPGCSTSLGQTDSLLLRSVCESGPAGTGQQCTSNKTSVLIAGDSSVTQCRSAMRQILGHDRRVTVFGAAKHTLATTVSFCSKWLRRESDSLVIIHSGLNDVFSIDGDKKSKGADTIERSCTAIRELFATCQQSRSTLMVCSIPEVVDFKNRVDYRYVAFDFNIALKSLANELGFEFIDIAPKLNTGRPFMAGNGVHYNKNGQDLVANVIMTPVTRWLGIHPVSPCKGPFTKRRHLNDKDPPARSPRRVKTSSRSSSRNIPATRHLRRGQYGEAAGSLRRGVPLAPTKSAMSFDVSNIPKKTSSQYWQSYRFPEHSAYPLLAYGSARPSYGHNAVESRDSDKYLNPWVPGAVPWS